MQFVLVIGQVMVVVFLVFHDWVPLGKLSNMAGLRSVDTTSRSIFTTALSALPFAAVLVASIHFASVAYPKGLLWWLWGTCLVCAYGIRFAGTHGFLPERNGTRPDTLRVAFHAL